MVALSRKVLLAILPMLFSAAPHAEVNETQWPIIKQALFADRVITEATAMHLDGPRGAENAAQVPITLTLDTPATTAETIHKVSLLVDANPIPLVAVYHLHLLSASQQISTRIRMESDSHIRAIAETVDGRLVMTTLVVHAGGGCAGPVNWDEDTIRATAGQIRLRYLPPFKPGEINTATFMVRHPMFTGLQRDVKTGIKRPAFYIRKALFRFNEEEVFSAELGVGTSEDPLLRFTYLPKQPGLMRVDVEDSNGKQFFQSIEVGL